MEQVDHNQTDGLQVSVAGKYCGPMRISLGALHRGPRENWTQVIGGSGRLAFTHRCLTAIYQALKLIGLRRGERVLAPAYNCGSEIDAILFAGAEVVLYGIGRDLSFQLAEIECLIDENVRAVYVTHYWGFPHMLSGLRELCTRRGVALIEDCALSLLSRGPTGPVGSTGDLAVFSLTKSLPVPDGGALVINNGACNVDEQFAGMSVSWPFRRALSLARPRFADRLLRGFFASASGARARAGHDGDLPEGQRPDMPRSYYFDPADAIALMSPLTGLLLRALSPYHVIARRRRNFQLLSESLTGIPGISPLIAALPEGVCPLVFPVLVKDRQRVSARLNDEGIDAICWWAGYHRALEWDPFPDACFLKDSVLALPIHQCIGDAGIARIARTLAAIVKGK